MTEDELIELGLAAESLLQDERFQTLYKLSGQRIAAQFLALPFERREEVNELHIAKCGMDFFERQLKQYQSAKDEIAIRRERDNNPPVHLDFE